MRLPVCPEHPGSKVVKGGWFGTEPHRRQRWWCIRGGDRHRFTEAMPRFEARDRVCGGCQEPIDEWAGEPAPKLYGFTAAQIARTLVRVAGGETYRSAAELIRNQALRPLGTTPTVSPNRKVRAAANRHASIVSDWVDTFAPALWDRFGTRTWPDSVVVDAKSFRYRTPSGPPNGYQAFTVLAATTTLNGRSRPVFACSAPVESAEAWNGFFSTIPGPIGTVVSDGSTKISDGVTRWARRYQRPEPDRWRCEFHLAQNIRRALGAATVAALEADPSAAPVLRQALTGPRQWAAFVELVDDRVGNTRSFDNWVRRNDMLVEAQVKARSTYDGPKSNGSVEQFLDHLGSSLSDRCATFTNKTRLDRLLLLMTMAAAGNADADLWTEVIRDHVTALAGRPANQRRHVEADSSPSLHRFRH
jgi:hypothetical protein